MKDKRGSSEAEENKKETTLTNETCMKGMILRNRKSSSKDMKQWSLFRETALWKSFTSDKL